MAAIARLPLEIDAAEPQAQAPWTAVARAGRRWADAHGIVLRDVIVLVPFAQLLAPARRAFARQGGWQPRIETTQTLARSLGPPAPPEPWQLAFDTGRDRLAAARLLASRAGLLTGAHHDPRRFEQAIAALVDTAKALARAAAHRPPAQRGAWWEVARAVLMPGGPDRQERALARLALEWAALAPAPATDRLFGLQPAAWIAVEAGGNDPLVDAVLADAAPHRPCLLLDADAVVSLPVPARPVEVVCDGFEEEAQRSAAQVIVHLQRGETPVALIGQDRLLVRRVRALLERRAVPLVDETGWTLSTTRAAAQVMLLLRAAAPHAATDTLLDWLKLLPGWPGQPRRALRQLEDQCRRGRLARVSDLDRLPAHSVAAALWQPINELLQRLRGGRHTVSRWLSELRDGLADSGAGVALGSDEAGRAVLAALHLDSPAWFELPDDTATPLPLDGFVAWVDAVLESASFVPTPASEPQVVLTPLATAMLRPFAAVVCPGADDRHLGARPAPHALLSDTLLRALGLDDSARRQALEARVFAQLLRLPRVSFLRRRDDDGEPLAQSPLLQQLVLDLARRGERLVTAADPRTWSLAPATPVPRPLPVAAALLPQRLSASATQALRDCPYRFYARHLLGLSEADELDGETEKREYGSWLHEVLHVFHAGRAAPQAADTEQAALHRIALEVQQRQGLRDEDFLPFAASFASFVPAYVTWLHQRDAAGAVWQAGEQPLSAKPAALQGIELHGRIDRVDRLGPAEGVRLQLIDYKTGSVAKLKKSIDAHEDTQLAFYAALQRAHSDAPLRAIYLSVDGAQKLKDEEHADVEAGAERLLAGLADDFAALRAGAALPALGEGALCAHCEARGLCRRDHWVDVALDGGLDEDIP